MSCFIALSDGGGVWEGHGRIGAFDKGGGGGSPKSPVNFKKWQCPLSLFF